MNYLDDYSWDALDWLEGRCLDMNADRECYPDDEDDKNMRGNPDE